MRSSTGAGVTASVLRARQDLAERSGPRRRPWYRHLLVFAALVALWYLVALLVRDDARAPSPLLVASASWPMLTSGELALHLSASLVRVAVGYSLAILVGVPLGMLLALNPLARRVLDPPLEMLRPIPPLALLPILMALVGVGDVLTVIVVFKAAVFPILLNSYAAVREVERVYQEAALTLGAPPRQVLRRVVLPAALPGIFTGLRLGLQFAWMSIVAAELIGASSGMGFLIVWYKQFLLMNQVVVGMVVIGLVGFALDRALVWARRRVLVWQA